MKNKKTIEESIAESFSRIFGDSANFAVKPKPYDNSYQIWASEIAGKTKLRIESRDRSKVLLKEAYEKGEFDLIIQHLEEAKKLK